MNYRHHILFLAKRFRITVEESALTDTDCKAWKRARKVQILPVQGFREYVLALHELSHIIFRVPRLTLDKEIVAWRGARKIAREWTEEANSIERECLASYIAHYKGDGRIRISRQAREYLGRVGNIPRFPTMDANITRPRLYG